MKHLVVNADDFGMCHAVNQGIVQAFLHGLVSQASIMAPCPWFAEAVELARQHRIPIGVHLTATCEWQRLRWRPLTSGRSLVQADGTCHTTIPAARSACDRQQLEEEFIAQIERVIACGIQPQHADVHMDMVDIEVFTAVCRRFDLPAACPPSLLTTGTGQAYPFTSVAQHGACRFPYISALPGNPQEAVGIFSAYLASLGDGIHYTACHPAIDCEEIRALVPDGHPAAPWARDIRVRDLGLVMDQGVRRQLDALGIQLAAMGPYPPARAGACPTPVAHAPAHAAVRPG